MALNKRVIYMNFSQYWPKVVNNGLNVLLIRSKLHASGKCQTAKTRKTDETAETSKLKTARIETRFDTFHVLSVLSVLISFAIFVLNNSRG